MASPIDIQSHRFIFIGGLHRSGTSLLFQILRDHPEISGFQQTGVPEDEGAHLQTVYTPPKYLGRAGFFALHPDAHYDETSPLITEANRQKLWDEWRPHWDADAHYLLEKSPGNILLTRFLQAMFPNAYFIIMTRHPVAVSLATRNWFWFYQPRRYRLDKLIENWVVAHERFRQDEPHLQHVLTITYEDLVQQPDSVLSTVYDFLHIPSYSHRYNIKRDLNKQYFDQWRQLQSHVVTRPFIGFITRRYGDRVRQLGYDLNIDST